MPNVSATRDNLLANIAQQAGGALLFLFIPAILGVQEFGRVTVIMTLISLAVISDFGFSHVYTRKMPGVLAGGSDDEVLRWDVASSASRIFGGAVFGVLGAGYFWLRTGLVMEAALLALIFPCLAAAAFLVSREVVAGNFRTVRNLSLIQSLGRLISIPASAIAGVGGWMAGQLISSLAVFLVPASRMQLARLVRGTGRLDGMLVRTHFGEALLLCLIAGVWTQLMTSARLFAVFGYPEATVARYGLVASLYQVGASLILAAFVPQTIRLYRLLAHDLPAGLTLALRLSAWGGLAVLILAVAGAVVATPLLAWLFPKYEVSATLAVPILLSVVNCAIVSALGSLMIGTGNAKTYGLILASSFLASLLLPAGIAEWFGMDAAANAQLWAMSANSVLLMVAVMAKFWRHLDGMTTAWVSGLLPIATTLLVPVVMSLSTSSPSLP